MAKKIDQGMAADIIGVDPRRHQEVDEDAQVRGAQPGFAVLSLRADDAGARHLVQGSGRADHAERPTRRSAATESCRPTPGRSCTPRGLTSRR